MNHQDKLNAFKKYCISTYPSISNYDFKKSANLISDIEIPLSKNVTSQISNFIETMYSISRKPVYQKFILDRYPEYSQLIKPSNYSVLMSYDFHIDSNDQAKLIEINTNASSYVIGSAISTAQNNTNYNDKLKADFISEFSNSNKPIKNIVIIDEGPQDQFMYLEFLMFKDLFTSWGYHCSILDYRDLKYNGTQLLDKSNSPIDFIYNRYCDFDLSDESSKHLLQAYVKNECMFSPNPKEYLLLADKNRMVEWCTNEWKEKLNLDTKELETLASTLIPSTPINKFNSEELWANKKKYFFKPTQSFGGKSVYRGKSITKGTFERLLSSDTLVQEFIPAPTIKVDDLKWKYDIRVFAYKNKINYSLARVYQGQVTNLQTFGGGLSLII